MIPLFLQGFALGLTAAASPGPFQAFLISQTLHRGFQRSATIALAPLVSDGPIIIGCLLLLDHLPAFFLRGVGLAGGLFVLYMAWGIGRQLRVSADQADPADPVKLAGRGRWSLLRQGVVMNLLSPGPYTFWTLVLGPILLNGLRQSIWHGGTFLLGFYLTLITGMLAIAFVFHLARRLGPRIVRALSLASLFILVGFGGILIVQSLFPGS